MDSTVIQEIANQLGMAADQAGMFITEQLPNYAALKTVQATVGLTIAWSCFLIPAIVAIVAISITLRHKKSDKEHRYEDGYKTYGQYGGHDYSDYASFFVFVFAGIAALIVLIFALCATTFILPEIIGWSNYPEAMLIDMALKAVG